MVNLIRFAFVASILRLVNGSTLVSRTGSDPLRYSACYPDRGYTKDDAVLAGNYLIQNATFDDGVYLTKQECIYHRADTTVVSVCNGSGRNRTITRGEVRRGIEQLQKDCGGGGTFNGVHVVNNLTFAAYGVTGARPMIVPPGNPNPDLPTKRSPQPRSHAGRLQQLDSRQAIDPCRAISFNGISRYDCLRKYNLNADGTCGGELTPENKCSFYCEVRRTGFLGIEQTIEGVEGNEIPSGTGIELQEGIETTVSHGFSLGAEGIFKDVFAAGITYEYSYSVTKTKSTTRTSEDIPPETWGRWAVFPKYVESCGTITRQNYIPPLVVPCGPGCIPVPGPGVCSGNVETLGNQCTMTPQLIDGVAQSVWVLRYERPLGTVLPISEQSESYKLVCWENRNAPPTGNPDQDPELECQAPPK